MISLNTNLMAQNSAKNFNNHYSKLATSTRNLSSGLRINSAADDASGLAVRELMRTDIAAIHQGVRNASDAISMIQVADGALAVIDEKLIRMKELAEQAATGTYDSTQRLLIDSEFQAMGEEIDRIARATDFNGIKLLDYAGENDGAKKAERAGKVQPPEEWINYRQIDGYDIYTSIIMSDADKVRMNNDPPIYFDGDFDFASDTDIKNFLGITDVTIFSDGTWRDYKFDGYDFEIQSISAFAHIFVTGGGDIGDGLSFWLYWEDGGGHLPSSATYRLTVIDPNAADEPDPDIPDLPSLVSDIPEGKVKIHFGPMNDVAEDYYYIDRHDATRAGLGLEGVKVQTQDGAQSALVTINDAIVAKDKIRAEYGTMQNRLENAITNLTIQAENLQAAESRISDADIATEMTEFVRNQVLAQSAIAMIAQANSMPQIAMRLIA